MKQYILSKVYDRNIPGNDSLPSPARPVSPITFASARNSFDSNFEVSLEDDPAVDLEPYYPTEPTRQMRTRQTPIQRVASSVPESPIEQPVTALPTHHYSMLAFSTGQLLEDDYSLAWYGLRPHELLGLHPPGTIVRLQREVMLEYVKPYLELDVRALRVITNDSKDTHALGSTTRAPDTGRSSPNKIRKAKDPAPGGDSRGASAAGGGNGCAGSPATQSTRMRRKMRLEWRDRYLVIRQGMLSLFKSRTVSLWSLRAPLRLAGRPASQLVRAFIACFFFF